MKTLLLTALLAFACFAQTKTADSPGSNLPAHKIGANDLLSLSVYDAPELSRMVRVSEDGYIRLPLLKSRIKVAGAMPVDVEALVSKALESEEILVEPVVTVAVADYSSRPINVAGAVRQPKTFQVIGPMRLLDAISNAGGLSEAAGSDILVSIAGEPTQRIPVKGLFESADASLNIVLHGGEDIRVVEAGKAFVVGNVKRPGAFALRDTEESSILQLLAMAEGLAPFASKQAYIYRRDENGVRKEIGVELDMILRRKRSDVAVLADDILYIPENSGRKLGIAALEKALLFGTSAGATALIYSSR
ncbi:MAG TPA: polysaccharide biosynthesis/export family protein [Bryobacteraceae bacterium]|nr:polysaccharide biosynthesis/export family protein [Bryobacteraceae bacterium]